MQEIERFRAVPRRPRGPTAARVVHKAQAIGHHAAHPKTPHRQPLPSWGSPMPAGTQVGACAARPARRLRLFVSGRAASSSAGWRMGCKSWRGVAAKIIFILHGEAQHNPRARHSAGGQPQPQARQLSELTPWCEQARAVTAAPPAARRRRHARPSSRRSAHAAGAYALQQNLGDVRVRSSTSTRVREQEFEIPGGRGHAAPQADREEVGRFYYRRPTGESGADVYDGRPRCTAAERLTNMHPFWRRRAGPDDALLVVTHGPTMRLLMMRYSTGARDRSTVYNRATATSGC